VNLGLFLEFGVFFGLFLGFEGVLEFSLGLGFSWADFRVWESLGIFIRFGVFLG
jgi:hypothetical protein